MIHELNDLIQYSTIDVKTYNSKIKRNRGILLLYVFTSMVRLNAIVEYYLVTDENTILSYAELACYLETRSNGILYEKFSNRPFEHMTYWCNEFKKMFQWEDAGHVLGCPF